jgi:hypothetical protein
MTVAVPANNSPTRVTPWIACFHLRGDNRSYFRYVPAERDLVHRENLLACSSRLERSLWEGVVRRPGFGCAAHEPRRPAQPRLLAVRGGLLKHWVDNFHTGYVLEALGLCEPLDGRVRPALERGSDSWERELFLKNGTLKYTPSRLYPIDAHNYAQAVETWLSAAAWRRDALEHADRCQLLVERMLTRTGYVAFHRRRWWTRRVPSVRGRRRLRFRELAWLELVRSRGTGR